MISPPYPQFQYAPIQWANLKYLVLHHTAGSVAATQAGGTALCLAIDASHRRDRGWTCIGYNFLVGAGTAFEGRAYDRPNGANYDSVWNPISLSICWLGDSDRSTPATEDRYEILALASRVQVYVTASGGGTLARRGHRDEPRVVKSCPGDGLYAWWRVEPAALRRTLRLTAPMTRGADVTALQRLLRVAGHSLTADGLFGPATRTAVISVQRDFGIPIDGVYGPVTHSRMSGIAW
jgi:hypothetical protein